MDGFLQGKHLSFMHHTQQWVVDGGNPKPDAYITVLAPGYTGKIPATYLSFDSQEQALERARALGRVYKVSKIRIFHPLGHSQLVK